MQQYQHTPKESAAEKTHTPANESKDLASLRDTVRQQQMEIDDLKRTVRRLQNEVRGAVNAFNLRNHG